MSIIGNTLQGLKRQSVGVLLSILVGPAPRVALASIPPATSVRIRTPLPFPHLKESDARDKSNVITVDFEMRPGDEGVLISGGDFSEDFSLEVSEGRVVWAYISALQEKAVIAVSDRLPMGFVTVRYEFGPEQPIELGKHQKGKMFVNGKLVEGSGTFTFRSKSLDYLFLDFTFTGTIIKVSLDETPSP